MSGSQSRRPRSMPQLPCRRSRASTTYLLVCFFSWAAENLSKASVTLQHCNLCSGALRHHTTCHVTALAVSMSSAVVTILGSFESPDTGDRHSDWRPPRSYTGRTIVYELGVQAVWKVPRMHSLCASFNMIVKVPSLDCRLETIPVGSGHLSMSPRIADRT